MRNPLRTEIAPAVAGVGPYLRLDLLKNASSPIVVPQVSRVVARLFAEIETRHWRVGMLVGRTMISIAAEKSPFRRRAPPDHMIRHHPEALAEDRLLPVDDIGKLRECTAFTFPASSRSKHRQKCDCLSRRSRRDSRRRFGAVDAARMKPKSLVERARSWGVTDVF